MLESICKESKVGGNDLYAKINDLINKGVLTQARADILHKIRTLGNSAAHEVNPHSESQLSLATDVASNLLQDVYILSAKSSFRVSVIFDYHRPRARRISVHLGEFLPKQGERVSAEDTWAGWRVVALAAEQGAGKITPFKMLACSPKGAGVEIFIAKKMETVIRTPCNPPHAFLSSASRDFS